MADEGVCSLTLYLCQIRWQRSRDLLRQRVQRGSTWSHRKPVTEVSSYDEEMGRGERGKMKVKKGTRHFRTVLLRVCE